jgi:hypothetical protein
MARDPYRRHTRRMRRAMRKNGNNPYGVLIIGPDEPYGLIILAAISRWAFRHRSAFYPFWARGGGGGGGGEGGGGNTQK